MVKRKADVEIKKIIESYIAKISQYYMVDAVYLFGSFANGNQDEDSDIDIAVISKDIKNEIDDMGKLFALTRGIDTRIEPHPIRTEEFRNRETPFIDEIIRTGIPIRFNVSN